MRKRKQKRGDIVKIDVGDSRFCYALALGGPLYAFFGELGLDEEKLAQIVTENVLFTIPVMDYAVINGRWKIVGHIELGANSSFDRVLLFKQDGITGKLTSYDPISGEERAISFGEACLLERASVWDPQHVEDRLRDGMTGAPNRWLESLRPRN